MPAPTIHDTDPVVLQDLLNSVGLNGLNPDIAARALKTFKPADLTALAALTTGLTEGDQADVASCDCLFRWTGTAWEQITVAKFATTAARDTEYAKASGVYKVAGRARAFVTADGLEYSWIGSAWTPGRPTNVQLDTTNSVVQTIPQAGMGKIVGNGTGQLGETVTFPQAFTSVPVIIPAVIGSRATGPFNPVGLALAGGTPAASLASTTGFTLNILAASGNYSAANDYYYSWIAIGAV